MKTFRLALAGVLPAFVFLLPIQPCHAGTATWKMTPQDGNWNNVANWAPPTIPNGPNDTARFGFSNVTNVTISTDIEVNSIVFMPGASAYNIVSGTGSQTTTIISGTGVTNNSGIVQNFVYDPWYLIFKNTAFAGNLTTYTAEGGTQSGEAGGTLTFADTSKAANATLIANGGSNGGLPGAILFSGNSTGGTAQVMLNGGNLDISAHIGPVTIGSITGDPDGTVYLGSNKAICVQTYDSICSCTITGTGGSLTKVGTGTLTLGGANTYTGGTTVNAGALLLQQNGNSSQTGTGNVTVAAGTLGGNGIIKGAVTIGRNGGPGAFLAPGNGLSGGVATITMLKTLNVINSALKVEFDSGNVAADQVVARGVVINPGATFSFSETGTGTMQIGTTFTLINNTAVTPISGTFVGLPEGATFDAGQYTWQVSYIGGNGNDFTATIIEIH